MPSAEETQMALNYELAVYREQISMIKRETERVSLTTIDLSNALRTVESMASEKVLIPIGGGALAKGSVTDTKILMPIGGEYLVEMEKKEATDEIKRRIDATRKAIERLNEEFTKIAGKVQDVSTTLQQMQMQNQLNQKVDSNIREDYV
jgi:prefoldin alpha subunit